ncbi:unnamed protein product [Medioppia subpectinata]|uniref:Uncharacterized protein n=1 Tax=Medioppia subpectinata TaxID=1979941 RepID=A0A7R9PT95_9ACAR|nr:unnamed protein product [Medioppia subpectinata]CAG2100201.1 unnamed protein product [Medioppia subpectinata]
MFIVYVLAVVTLVSGHVISSEPDIYQEVRESRNFDGKVALVTGSNSGIGEQIVKLYSALGASVVVTGRKEADIARVAKEAQALSPKKLKPLEVVADLTVSDELENLLKQTVQTFGKLDVLVNDADIFMFANFTADTFWKTFDSFESIGVRSPLHLIQMAAPALIKSKGTVINISSVLSQRPQKAMLAYELQKQALEMATKVLALELAPFGIRVNTLSPGATQSHPVNTTNPHSVANAKRIADATPLGRVGLPIDMAKGVVFLSSTDASFITGHNLVVDGGLRFNLDSGFMTVKV